MANLYLHFYESEFMTKLTKENYGIAKKFNHTRRFIDDLNTLNNDGQLEKYYKEGEIYPKEMIMNLENDNNKQATFLDMEERIDDSKIITQTYDKRDDFNFEIVNYPDLTGNIPKRPTYGIFGSQLIRYARICSLKEDLMDRILELTRKLYKKKFKVEYLKNTSRKCLEKNEWIKKKFELTSLNKILEEAQDQERVT